MILLYVTLCRDANHNTLLNDDHNDRHNDDTTASTMTTQRPTTANKPTKDNAAKQANAAQYDEHGLGNEGQRPTRANEGQCRSTKWQGLETRHVSSPWYVFFSLYFILLTKIYLEYETTNESS
jgi:hypothetical protein